MKQIDFCKYIPPIDHRGETISGKEAFPEIPQTQFKRCYENYQNGITPLIGHSVGRKKKHTCEEESSILDDIKEVYGTVSVIVLFCFQRLRLVWLTLRQSSKLVPQRIFPSAEQRLLIYKRRQPLNQVSPMTEGGHHRFVDSFQYSLILA